MRLATITLGLGLALAAGCQSAPMAQAPAPLLPLKTLRLYETGVGYFERSGPIQSGSLTALPVPAGHLDDALKSLVVLSPNGQATVQGLEFSSSVGKAMARTLAGLPSDPQTILGYQELLTSLKGASVELRTRQQTLRGRIVEVVPPPADSKGSDQSSSEKGEDKAKPAPHQERPEFTLLLLTDQGEVQRFAAGQIQSVRPLDPVFAARLGAALDSLSSQGAQSRRLLRVLTDASGPVTLGYIAETPLWRSTYRLVLSQEPSKGMLQGWALVHNDTDEDWHGIQVHLVNGRPDSFLFPLAAPRYARRELVHPDEPLSTVPQLLDTTPDALWGDHLDTGLGLGGIGTVGYGSGSGHGAGYGSGHGRAPSVRMGATTVTTGSSLLEVGNLAKTADAQGVESGALFSYQLAKGVDLRAHGSALMPFLQQPVQARELALFEQTDEPARTTILFINSTSQTLPTGPIALFARGGFAGESSLDRLKPSERRFIQFGTDPDVELTLLEAEAQEQTKRLVLKASMLEQHFIRQSTRRYRIENRSGTRRDVGLVLDLVQNTKLEGSDEVEYDSQTSHPMAIFHAPAKQKVDREIHAEEGLTRGHPVGSLTSGWFEKMAAADSLPKAERDVVLEAAAKQKDLEHTVQQKDKVKADTEKAEKDREQLREDLKAAGGDKGQGTATQPLIRRLLEIEDRLTALRKQAELLETQQEERQKAVYQVLQKLAPAKTP